MNTPLATVARAALVGALVLVRPTAAQGIEAALQRAVLIEQQEGDLAAAEQAYRAVLQDAAADDPLGAAAALRLGELLWRLDRRDEATPLLQRVVAAGGAVGDRASAVLEGRSDPRQDPAVAERVRALLPGALERSGQACTDLRWLGTAAVPELLRQIERRRAEAVAVLHAQPEASRFLAYMRGNPLPQDTNPMPAMRGTLQVIELVWTIGGDEARSYLQAVTEDADRDWRLFCAAATGNVQVAADLFPVVEAFLSDRDRNVALEVVRQVRGMPLERIIAVLQLGDELVRARIWEVVRDLDVWQRRPLRDAAFAQLQPPLVRDLGSPQPTLAREAFQFLWQCGQCIDAGMTLVLEWLPRVPVFEATARKTNETPVPAPLERIAACASKLGPFGGSGDQQGLQKQYVLIECVRRAAVSPEHVHWLLDVVELGYDLEGGALRKAIVTAQRPEDLVRAAGMLDRVSDISCADLLAGRDLPAEAVVPIAARLRALLPSLPPAGVDRLELALQKRVVETQALLGALARTGNSEAVATMQLFVPRFSDPVARHTVELADRAPVPAVLVLLRELLVRNDLSRVTRNEVFGALVRAGDAAAIPLLPQAYALGLDHTAKQNSPIGCEWLVPVDGRSRRGFDDAGQQAAWQVLLAAPVWPDVLAHLGHGARQLSPALRLQLIETIAGKDLRGLLPRDGVRWSVNALVDEAPDGDGVDAERYRAAVAALCEGPFAEVALNPLSPAVTRKIADRLLPLLQPAGAAHVVAVYRGLRQAEVAVPPATVAALLRPGVEWGRRDLLELLPPEPGTEILRAVEAMTREPDSAIREAACLCIGRLLAIDSTGALLAAMRDPDDSVRAAANTAMQAIRTYHDQRTWLEGKETGIATGRDSVAAKLLAQARPDQPKERRLLALRSLGDLGEAVALPYLIDWSGDADAEVAAAARAAIERVHVAASSGGK